MSTGHQSGAAEKCGELRSKDQLFQRKMERKSGAVESCYPPRMRVSNNLGVLLSDPYVKDPIILGPFWVPVIVGGTALHGLPCRLGLRALSMRKLPLPGDSSRELP